MLRISVIIPVRNEQSIIEKTLRHLRDSAPGRELELIVADGQSDDDTPAIAARLADVVVRCPKKGRAHQMNQGALKAKGDLLLFLHSDTKLPDGWADLLEKTWTSAKPPSLSAFRLNFDSSRFYFRFMCFWAHIRTRWLTGVPHGDQALAVRSETYMRCGGFPDVPIMEEYYLARKLKKEGRLHLFREEVITSDRRYRKHGPLYNNMRNLLIIMLFYMGVNPHRLARLYK